MSLRPSLWVPDLCRLDFAALAQQGLRYYCLDVDNTLARQDDWQLHPGVREHFEAARQAGHVLDACLISNVIFGPSRLKRLRHIGDLLGVRHVYGAHFWDCKPGPRAFKWAMARMGSNAGNTAVVGDQLFSDILGGNRLGMYTVLVDPLGHDHWTTRLLGRRRRQEKLISQLGIRRYAADADGAMRQA